MPVVAIPISLIGAVFLMQIFGFTVNLLTLLAIVLSVGLVVDDAIVVVENVERTFARRTCRRMNAALVGARELIGPIIAMTITLAAVYTPIGLQGGLTGTLFREFAFTLAGAVFISGVVALTLSPMMSANLLRAGHADKGFSGVVNQTFDRFRDWYGRHLDRTLKARPAVYIVWVGISLLAVIMFAAIPKLGTKELAPTEDQGVIFGIITAPANATIDDTIRYADAAGKVFQNIPETRFTFQITFPDNGFGGMVLKPWGERKTPTKAYLPQIQEKLGAIPGIQMFPIMPSALPGADNFPVSFVITSTADQERILEFAKQIFAKAMQAHIFQFGDIDTKIDQPQSADRFRSRQGRGARSRHAASRRRYLGQHRRQLRQPVQHRRAQLQSDSADQTRGSLKSRAVEKHLRHRTEQPAHPAEHGRFHQPQDRRAFAQSDAAAQRGHHQRRSGRFARSGSEVSARTRRTRFCQKVTSSITPASRVSCGPKAANFWACFCFRSC